MPANSTVSKIYWPAHLCTRDVKSGFLIGWNVRSFTACIATIVPDTSILQIERVLNAIAYATDPVLVEMNARCGVAPAILGVCTVSQHGSASTERRFHAEETSRFQQNASLWVTIHLSRQHIPVLRSLHCCGLRFRSVCPEVILYDRPKHRHMQRLIYSAGSQQLDIMAGHSGHSAPTDSARRSRRHHARRLSMHSRRPSISSTSPAIAVANDLETVLCQINVADRFETELLNRGLPPAFADHSTLPQRWLRSISLRMHACLGRLWLHAQSLLSRLARVWSAIAYMLILCAFQIRVVVELCLALVAWRPLPAGPCLRDVSLFVRQLDLRLRLLGSWPSLLLLLSQQRGATHIDHAAYIRFYNGVWLMANDIIFGLALGSFMLENATAIGELFGEALERYSVNTLQMTIEWLMGWPAGLKLNGELDAFLGEMFLWMLQIWSVAILSIKPVLPSIVKLVGAFGITGGSMMVSLATDILSLLTLHVYWFYVGAARIYHWQLVILRSLFNLFRGKKRNVLRHRIDSHNYDLDQLLIGTILFTLLAFLFPTVAVYYSTFCTSRVILMGIRAVCELMLALFNHFPLFLIMLRVKDPARLPGGLCIRYYPTDQLAGQHGLLFSLVQRVWRSMRSALSPGITSWQARRTSVQSAAVRGQQANRSEGDIAHSHPVSRREGARSSSAGTTIVYLKNSPISYATLVLNFLTLWRRILAHYFSRQTATSILTGQLILSAQELPFSHASQPRETLQEHWVTLRRLARLDR